MRKYAAILLAILLLAGGSYWYFSGHREPESAGLLQPENRALVSLGETVYAENCASCHGANLEGEPNWQTRGEDGLLPAPPHDTSGHTWHHADEILFGITKYGVERYAGQGYRSNMPAYEGLLSDEEIIAVLSYIKAQWPEEVQSQHDMINRSMRSEKQ